MKQKLLIALGIASIGVLALVAVTFPPRSVAEAAGGCTTSCDLTGWAWSSTIGWISFNSSNTSSGGGTYKVSIDSSGDFSGYAWSGNIGWVSFNSADVTGANSCFAGAARPHVDFSNGTVSGWARALAGLGRTDGWDGCIELAGTNHPSVTDTSGPGGISLKGVHMSNTGALSGFAWGSTNVGWISFDGDASSSHVTCPTCTVVASSVSATCNTTQTSPDTSPVTATFTITAVGGTGSYTYSFDGGGSWVPGNSKIQTGYTVSTAGPIVAAKDSADVISPTAQCNPNVTVTPSTPAGVVKLFIGPVSTIAGLTAASTGHTHSQITRGHNFALKWFETAAGYTCDPGSVTSLQPAGTTVAPGFWGAGKWDTTTAVDSDGVSTPIATNSSMPAGEYTFSMSCTATSDGSIVTPKVTLKLVSSSSEEF